jgi:CBS domain-containing protein
METATAPTPDVPCPACGHDNIRGVDVCAECGQSIVADAPDGSAAALTRPLLGLSPAAAVTVERDASLADAIALLKGRNVGCVLVTSHDELVGIFTERDVLYRVAGLIEDLAVVPVESLMTPQPTSLRPSDPISHALHLMALHGFRHVPLVDEDGRPVGIVSLRDIMRFMEEQLVDR